MINRHAFSTNPQRVPHQEARYAMTGIEMAKHSDAKWLGLLYDDAGFPRAPAQDFAGMIAREQTRVLIPLQPVSDSTTKSIGLPVSFDGMRPALPVRSFSKAG